MKVLVAFGTRPEAIKMAPVVKELQRLSDTFDVSVCVTGQHREMLDDVLSIFKIIPDFDLNLMRPNQDLATLTTSVLCEMQMLIKNVKPDLVIVHGDTTTAMATSIAAFYTQTKLAHVEAGLRSGDIQKPFPEEFNRITVSNIADLHFAPTHSNKNNLIQAGFDENKIHITGNTVIDALFAIRDKFLSDKNFSKKIDFNLEKSFGSDWDQNPYVLVTGHRRENFGAGIRDICDGIARVAEAKKSVNFFYPVHLNPNVAGPVHALLKNLPNVKLTKPVGYFEFVRLLMQSALVLTDSGGIQEEAPSLGKPVLVMRENTERPEAIEANCALLVGTDPDRIFENTISLLEDKIRYDTMANAQSPFGNGDASKLIVEILSK